MSTSVLHISKMPLVGLRRDRLLPAAALAAAVFALLVLWRLPRGRP